MRRFNRPVLSMLAGAVVLAASLPARADDTEIFMSQPASNVQPNIMLILDTSGSMNEVAESSPLPYDPTVSYSNNNTNCQSDRVYYYTSNTPPASAPRSCSASGVASIPLSQLKCGAALPALTWGSGSAGPGFYSDSFIRWGGRNNNRSWNSSLSPDNAADVECKSDAGVHGPDASSSAKWPRYGTSSSSTGRYTSTAGETWWVEGNAGYSRTLYSPNYIRYVRNGPVATQTRMQIVKAAAASFLNSLPNLNVGVMRYDRDAEGGMVMSEVSSLDSKRAALISDITTSNRYEPQGNTPLSETLYEAYLYFSGGPVLYGDSARICTRVDSPPGSVGQCYSSSYLVNFPSVSASHDGTNYISPAVEPCQANYIVYLTDGLPTSDTGANSRIRGLPDFSSVVENGCDGTGDGDCLGALSEYMYETDLASGSNIRTFFIGFGGAFDGGLSGAFGYLDRAAKRGGGSAYQANDFSSLSAVFNTIITSILQTSTTFTTPTVAVNAFNRTQTLDDLFVSVFQPSSNAHWPGNLKKYRVVDGVIKDQDGENAVDRNSGFFAQTARSYWSATEDGSQVTSGGAANKLPAPADRVLYTYLGNNRPGAPVSLGAPTTLLESGNSALTTETFGLGATGDPTREEIIEWARGADLRNEDGDLATDVRRVMGDPIHSPPAVVIYGGTAASPTIDDGMVYLTTNDGYLHAVDPVSGEEQWAFVPQEYLPQLKELYFNSPVPAKPYGLDGEIQVLKYDVNGDGIVDAATDRVILYFGTGRGGQRYYAIDVTDKDGPRFLWSIGPADLPGVGQTWSTPTITRVNVSGASQNSQKLVLVMGGGYDVAQDGGNGGDSVGNRLFMVDALSGALLWAAGPSGATGVNLELSRMTHSIPAAVAVLDTDSDGYADRMYAGDMAAQLWRFDITNGASATELVAGGVMASLGMKESAAPDAERRFYSRPDVAALQRPGGPPVLNIAIGSGYRGHPLNTAIHDRFYSIRDPRPRGRMTQDEYDALDIIIDSELVDITDDVDAVLPAASVGWKLNLNRPSWRGEKSLSASNTFDNKIFFTTYTPTTGSSPNTCSISSSGSNRAYVVSAFNGAPVPRRDSATDPGSGEPGTGDDELTADDRYDELAQGGIAPEVAFLFPEKNEIICLSGVEVLNACKNFNSRVKTYWRESTAN